MAFIDIRGKSALPLATALVQTQEQLKKRRPNWAEVLGTTLTQVTGMMERREMRIGAEEQARVEAGLKGRELDIKKMVGEASKLTAKARWFEAQNELIKMGLPSLYLMNVGDGRQIPISFNAWEGKAEYLGEGFLSKRVFYKDLKDGLGMFDYESGEYIDRIPYGLVPEGWQLGTHDESGTAYAFNPADGDIKELNLPRMKQWAENQWWYKGEELKLEVVKVGVLERRLVLEQQKVEGDNAFRDGQAARDEKWRRVEAAQWEQKHAFVVKAQADSLALGELREARHQRKDASDIEIAISGDSRANMLARLNVVIATTEMNLAQLEYELKVETENFNRVQTIHDKATEAEKFEWKKLVDTQSMIVEKIRTDIAITGMEIEKSRLDVDTLNAWNPEKAEWNNAWVKLQNEGREALNDGELEILGIREVVAFVPKTMEEALEFHASKIALNAKLGVGGAMTMEDRKEMLDYEMSIQAFLGTLTQEQKIEFEEIRRGYDLEYLEVESGVKWELVQKELVLKADLEAQRSIVVDGTLVRLNDAGKIEILFENLTEPQIINVKTDTGLVLIGLVYPGDDKITWVDSYEPDTQAKEIEMINDAWGIAEDRVKKQMGAFAMLDKTQEPEYIRLKTAAFVDTLMSYPGVTEEWALEKAASKWIIQAQFGGFVATGGAQIAKVDTGAFIRGEAERGIGITFETPEGKPADMELVETPRLEPGKRLTRAEITAKVAKQIELFKDLDNPIATKKLQQALTEAGTYKGKVDGIWSKAVEKALEIAIRRNKDIADSLIMFREKK